MLLLLPSWAWEEFVILVLMITWLSNVRFDANYRVVELFAGVARIAKCSFVKGFKVAALDISYTKDSPRSMDVNAPAGFVYLASHKFTTT
jgi:hypothetical protein